MRKQPQRQYSFTAGQLDQPMIARADLEHYLKGALTLHNVVCIPTGGVTLRGGLVRDFEITDGAAGIRLGVFEVSPEVGLLTVFTGKKLKIYQRTTLKGDITTEYIGADLRDLDLNQKMDTMIITSKYYKFMELLRQGSNESWGFNKIELTQAPKYTYPDTTGGKNDIQQIKFRNFQNGDSIRISFDGEKTLSVIFDGSATVMADRIKNAINGLPNIDKEKGGVTVIVITAGSCYQVEFVGTDGKQNQPDLICAIEEQASTNEQVIVKCIQEGEPPLEDLWSEARGYPFSSCHCQGRLLFGGSHALPYIVNGSMTNNQYSFRKTEQNLDDEALEIPADTDGSCEIRRIYAMERFFVLTNKGIFAAKEMPLTPGAICNKQTDTPCAPIRPREIDSAMVYVTQNSEGINQTVASLTYTYENEKYKTDDLAFLAPSVMREPVNIDVRRSIKRSHATYLFVVNKDGTLAVLNTKQSQGLNGWSLCSTDGKFLDVAVINDITYFAVERTINGQKKYFLEHWDDNAKLDLGVTLLSESPKKEWTDEKLAVFNGQKVGVYTDGLPYGYAIIENSRLELTYAAKSIEVGIPFDWEAETMPAVVETEDFSLVGHRYRVPLVSVQLKDTAGININGQQVCNRFFGRDSWDKENILINGTKSIRQIGWFGDTIGREATIRCTGTSLQPATILSATMEVLY